MLDILNEKGFVIISYLIPGDVMIDIPHIKKSYPNAVKLYVRKGGVMEIAL